MTSSRIVRLAEQSDLDAICGIERASFPNPWSRAIYVEELGRETCVLEVADEPAVGVLGVSCTWQIAGEAHLLRIATHPDHRHRGIGGDLLSAVLARAQAAGCATIGLEVARHNQAAIALYERAGFAVVGVRTRYYRLPADDALVMVRPLREVREAH